MPNILIDGFPTKYKNYRIRTDFRIGIGLSLLLDEDIDDDIKYAKAYELLYIDDIGDDYETAYNGLVWFLSCGNSERVILGDKRKRSDDAAIDFKLDAMDIWGGFWSKGVDLENTKMHWFKFMAALQNLGDCQITQKMGYRQMDTSDLKGAQLRYYKNLKEQYKVREVLEGDEFFEYRKAVKEKEERLKQKSPYVRRYLERLGNHGLR